MQSADQGHDARDVGGGHRGAAEGGVGVVRRRAEDVHAGGAEIDARAAVVGERGKAVVVVGGGHRDEVGQVVAGGVEGGGVVVRAVVAGGADEDVPGVPGRVDGVVERLIEAAATPAVVGDGRPFGDRVA